MSTVTSKQTEVQDFRHLEYSFDLLVTLVLMVFFYIVVVVTSEKENDVMSNFVCESIE